MQVHRSWGHRIVPVTLGIITLASVAVLIAWDISPTLFPAHAHDFLAAFPLAMIAVAYLAYHAALRPAPLGFAKAILLALAFLAWAANQFWPNLRQATLFNDIAIALFVFDVFLVIVVSPEASTDPSPRANYCGK